MKKNVILIAILSMHLVIYSCKQKVKEGEESQATTTESGEAKSEYSSVSEPKTYTISTTPDTILLGKNKEAQVRIVDMRAIELSNPDGQSTGIEVRYKLELTNKTPIGGNTVGIATSDFRLELDNGNKIAPSSVYVSAEPEATKTSEDDVFTLPAGTKPVSLNLFFDQTRASVKLKLQ